MKERFDRHWVVNPNSGCWIWRSSLSSGGYGLFGVGSRTDKSKRMARAHRVAWEIYRGPIPAGTDVLHRCDNPPCVNPEHLWLGSKRDNARDRVLKNRHGNQILSSDDIEEIRHVSGETNQSVADKYKVSEATIRDIRSGRTWSYARSSHAIKGETDHVYNR